MKKLILVALVLSFNLKAEDKKNKNQVFEQRKARALEGLNTRKAAIEKAIACVNTATDPKTLKDCNQALKEERKAAREKMKQHREEMMKKRTERREKLINKKK